MAICINVPLVVIGSLSLTEMVKYDVVYNKLWKDADRNMNGTVSSTFIGIFPVIEAETKPLSPDDVKKLCTALDQPYFSVTFWDPATATQKTASYYASDYNISLKSRARGQYGSVDFSLVPVAKRS